MHAQQGKCQRQTWAIYGTMTVTVLKLVPRQPLCADPKSFHPLTLLVTDVYLNFRTICFLFLTPLLIYNSQTIQFTH